MRFVTLFLLVLPLYAKTPTQRIFEINGKKIRFVDLENRLTLSASCGDSVTKMTCDAYKATKQKLSKNIKIDLTSGANPGSLLCRHIEGRVVIGIDEKLNQNSFCEFKDGSLIDNGSLYYHLTR